MRGIRIDAHGGPEILGIRDLPDPVGQPGEIPVRITHVGLNHLDVWVRKGVPGHRFPLPLIGGSDAVGVREDTGERVALQPFRACGACARCWEGRQDLCRTYRIRGETMDGGLCERAFVRADELLPCPLPPEEAAAIPLALLTAWHLLVTRAGLRPGERVLVQAGASGVGIYAIQVAKRLGARVIATGSTPEKRALALQLGAEQAVPAEEAENAVKAWTDREGVDVVVEHVGAATFDASLRCLRWGGRLATCGATTGHEVKIDLRALFFKQLSLLGSTMGGPGELRTAWELACRREIVPVVDRVLPWERLAEAHAALESRAVVGKIVVALG